MAGGEGEDVVEVSADIDAAGRRPVDRRQVEAVDDRRGRRDEGLLQRAGQQPGALLRCLRTLLGPQELPLVRPSLGGVEDRHPHHDRAVVPVAFEHRVDEDG
jgi:hypothetical protein